MAPNDYTLEGKSKITPILKKAESFHGHLGPFLAIGVRAGLFGLDRLGISKRNQLAIEVSLPLCTPFSCILDGLQITTECTVGNQKLSVVDSPTIQARFRRRDNGREVVVSMNPEVLEKLKSQLLSKEALPDKEVRDLAFEVAAMPEDQLFAAT
jgi:formylmethanofuran dehydrogenase subunit E